MKKLPLILPLLLCLTSCDDGIDRKTPLGWCVWEIHNHEGYDCEWSYIYNEIQDHKDVDNTDIYAYYVTAFLDDRIGEWYCLINCRSKSAFDRATARTVLSHDEIRRLDCVLIREEPKQ